MRISRLPATVPLLGLAILTASCADAPPPGLDDAAAAVVREQTTRLTSVRRVHDRVVDTAGGPALEVTIVADGGGTARRIGVHASVDGGPWRDVEAARLATRNPATDLWTATVPAPAGFTAVEYVVWAEPVGGARLWSDHGGADYRTPARRPVAWAGQRVDGRALVVDLDVDNLAYDKSCFAIYTTDDWMRWQYTQPGSYLGGTGRAGIERWQVRIEPVDRAAVVEYAVTCSFGDGSPARWDSNLSGNFRFERAAPPVVTWTAGFSAAIDVEIASDGTVFALSTSDPPSGATPGSRRWLTVYAPDGSWRTLVTFSSDAERITYLPDADLLLAELWAPGGAVRRVALRRDGTTAWEQTAARGNIVDTVDAAFLTWPGEVARLGAAAPIAVPCVEPTLSPSGVAACVGDGATRVVDVDSGALLATLPAGEPYAISDDGQIVVLGAGGEVASGYITSLTAYRLDGTIAWSRAGLSAPPDHGWGGPRVLGDCTNHVIDDVLGLVDQPADGASVLLLDVHTGAERRRVSISGGVVQACPAADDRFHWNTSYMRYGRWSDALDPADPTASIDHLDVGLNGAIGGLVPGGRIALVQKPYIAPSGDLPQPRLLITEPGGERFTDYLVVPAGDAAPLIDAAGRHAVIFTGRELVVLAL